MNKKILVPIFLLIIISIIFPLNSFAETNEFSNLTIDVTISEDGTASVTEVWNVSIYDGTEMYKPYYDMQTSEIQNFSVKENDVEYEFLSTWDINASQEDKKEKCGINTVSDGVELCWGIGDYGTHTYTITYEITNFVTDYEDYQMTYFTLVPTNMDPVPENVTITIGSTFEFTSSNITASGSGFTGSTNIVDGKVVLSTTSAMNSSQYMTIQIKYESGAFSTTDVISSTDDTSGYVEYDGYNGESYANINTNDSTNSTEQEESKSWTSYFPYILIVIAIIIFVAFMIISRRNNNYNNYNQ